MLQQALIGAFGFLSKNYRNYCLPGRARHRESRKYYGEKLKETLRKITLGRAVPHG
jgi:hypothetical protein